MRFVLFMLMVLVCSFGSAAQEEAVSGTVIAHGGGALTQEVIETLCELCGEPAKLVIIPTASRVADRETYREKLIEQWKAMGFDEVTVLHTNSRGEAQKSYFAVPISNAGCVWIGGGSQSRLEDIYVGTAVQDALHALLDRGGVIAGSSAGAAIMSNIIIRHGNPEPEEGRGFALVPESIILDQHFIVQQRQPRLLRMLERHPEHIGFGIDEDTAIVFHGDEHFVLGKSVVMRCADQTCVRLEPRPGSKSISDTLGNWRSSGH